MCAFAVIKCPILAWMKTSSSLSEVIVIIFSIKSILFGLFILVYYININISTGFIIKKQAAYLVILNKFMKNMFFCGAPGGRSALRGFAFALCLTRPNTAAAGLNLCSRTKRN